MHPSWLQRDQTLHVDIQLMDHVEPLLSSQFPLVNNPFHKGALAIFDLILKAKSFVPTLALQLELVELLGFDTPALSPEVSSQANTRYLMQLLHQFRPTFVHL